MMQIRLLLLFSLSFFYAITLSGQLQKGATIQFGAAEASYRTQGAVTSAADNVSTFDSYVSYGWLYFLTDHWAVGGGLGAAAVSNLRSGGGGLLPAARYYFNPEASSLHWFAATSANFEFTFGSQTEVNLNQWNLGGGFNHFLNENVLLEVGANLSFGQTRGGFFRHPAYNLGAGLQVYLSPEGREQKKSALPDIGRGSLLIGLSEAGLSYQPMDGDRIFNFSLRPTVGYFLTDRWAAGAGLTVSASQLRFNSNNDNFLFESSALSLGLNAFTRYYVGSPERRLRPFLLAELGVLHVNTRYEQPNQNTDFKGANTWLTGRTGVGANLFLAPRVALEGALTYSLGKGHNWDGSTFTNNRLGLDLGFQFFLGKRADR